MGIAQFFGKTGIFCCIPAFFITDDVLLLYAQRQKHPFFNGRLAGITSKHDAPGKENRYVQRLLDTHSRQEPVGRCKAQLACTIEIRHAGQGTASQQDDDIPVELVQ